MLGPAIRDKTLGAISQHTNFNTHLLLDEDILAAQLKLRSTTFLCLMMACEEIWDTDACFVCCLRFSKTPFLKINLPMLFHAGHTSSQIH